MFKIDDKNNEIPKILKLIDKEITGVLQQKLVKLLIIEMQGTFQQGL